MESANQISTDCSPAEDRIAAFDFGKRRYVPRTALRQRYTNSLSQGGVQCRPLAVRLEGANHQWRKIHGHATGRGLVTSTACRVALVTNDRGSQPLIMR